ncbi:hypothetical protein V8C40DRAFT_260549 [Trichoderma camerunense]
MPRTRAYLENPIVDHGANTNDNAHEKRALAKIRNDIGHLWNRVQYVAKNVEHVSKGVKQVNVNVQLMLVQRNTLALGSSKLNVVTHSKQRHLDAFIVHPVDILLLNYTNMNGILTRTVIELMLPKRRPAL